MENNTPFDLAALVDLMGPTTSAVMADAINMASSASAAIGVTVSTDEILACPGVREHVMTDGELTLDLPRVLSELKAQESVSRRIAETRADARSAAEIGKVADGMNKYQRMSFGRELIGDGDARKQRGLRQQAMNSFLSPDEQRERAARLNAMGGSPASRMTRAREAGKS